MISIDAVDKKLADFGVSRHLGWLGGLSEGEVHRENYSQQRI
jgi:hypothetical protein